MIARDIRKNEELKQRLIPVRISDNELEALAVKCGSDNITIQELFEVFIGDLINGTFYSGSDESDYIDQWYDRHGFSWMDRDTLLSHLLSDGTPDTVDDFITAWDEKMYLKEHPEEVDPETEPWWDIEIEEALEYFEGNPTDDDIKEVKEWLKNYKKLFQH